MTQPSVASYFNTRKRAAVDEISANRLKNLIEDDAPPAKLSTRSRTVRRIGVSNEVSVEDSVLYSPMKNGQEKLVKFIKAGKLSPEKKILAYDSNSNQHAFVSKESINNVERGTKTPNKQSAPNADSTITKDNLKKMVRKELKFDEVKSQLTRSAKLQKLKDSLNRVQELEKIRKAQEQKNKKLKEQQPVASHLTLKEFKTIDLEVLSSPTKQLKTPTKAVPPPPDKNGLMSPRKTETVQKLMFSPTKDGSPSKLIVTPAYQRFQNLTETGRPTLHMPYKYRTLYEIFKAVDTVCAMFFNRKEMITFKKLKPAVQRMLRKNFSEAHLAQIKSLFPSAFNFSQMKMRNYGSISKHDYYQLIITPNVENGQSNDIAKVDEENVLKSAQITPMNPQVMTERQQKFFNMLLSKVKDEHDKFLRSLNPPLCIDKNKLTRWHPDFDLENCPEIEKALIPQPPNIEKYSSAKDILSTARNLFNCATPMERAMERLEEHQNQLRESGLENVDSNLNIQEKATETPTTNLLKGVPKSLLEKIKAKQAAKVLDAMTRRPSQDQEAIKYSRLPELARHLRNVFVTEKRAVLPLEIVLKKIENSYRTNMITKDIGEHLHFIEKECPDWIKFHEIRKTIYVKIVREADLSKIIEKLENIANLKSK